MSTPTVSAAGGTDSATDACHRRAPSRCTRNFDVPRGGDQLGVLVRRGDRAARRVVGVLQAEQRGAQRVVRPRPPGGRPHRLHGHPARPLAPVDRLRHAAGQPRGRAQLVVQHVRAPRGEEPVAPVQVQRQRDEVAHRRARHPQRGVDAEQVGGPLLESAHRRVAVQHVVADLGARHGEPHGLVRLGDGVRTEVDLPHFGHDLITPHGRESILRGVRRVYLHVRVRGGVSLIDGACNRGRRTLRPPYADDERREFAWISATSRTSRSTSRRGEMPCGDPRTCCAVTGTVRTISRRPRSSRCTGRWRKIRDRGALDAYVRRTLVRAVIDESRRPWRRERFVDELPEGPTTDREVGDSVATRSALLDGLAGARPATCGARPAVPRGTGRRGHGRGAQVLPGDREEPDSPRADRVAGGARGHAGRPEVGIVSTARRWRRWTRKGSLSC